MVGLDDDGEEGVVERKKLRNKRQLCAIWAREELLLVGDK